MDADGSGRLEFDYLQSLGCTSFCFDVHTLEIFTIFTAVLPEWDEDSGGSFILFVWGDGHASLLLSIYLLVVLLVGHRLILNGVSKGREDRDLLCRVMF